jgi:hypothetical protein
MSDPEAAARPNDLLRLAVIGTAGGVFTALVMGAHPVRRARAA